MSNRAGNLALGIPKFTPAPPMGNWVDQAACAGLNPELFYPTRGGPTDSAKAVCGPCPVRTECLDYALTTNQPFGIWGGQSERARRRLRLSSITPEPAPGPRACECCGTTYRPGRRNQRFCSTDCRNYHRTRWNRRA